MSMGISSGQKWGGCFPARCPMCARDVTFHLLVKAFAYDTAVVGVICGACKFEVLGDSPEECEKLSRAAELWERHEGGELNGEAFVSALDELGSTTLARIVAESRTWKCPKCEYDIPLNYISCWNCSHERPLTAEERDLAPGEAEEDADDDPV